jgi:glycosyltransferase involved in cell wall biosynthesis
MAATPPDRPLRIVHYFPGIRLEMGGPVRMIIDLCNVLAARGHELVLITYDSPDIPPDWNTPGKPRTVIIPSSRYHNWLLTEPALKIVNQTLAGGGVAHLHTPWMAGNIQLARAALLNKVPYVVTTHGMLNDWPMSQRGPKKRFYLTVTGRRMLRRASRVHFTARAELDQSWKWIGRGTPSIVPCMVDLEPYRTLPGPDLARRTYPAAAPDGPVVLFLSRLHEKKGLDLLIDAFAIVRDSGSAARLLIAGVGTPEYEAAIGKQVRDRGLQDRVFFVGMARGDAKISLYQRADVFVLPTRQENFGLVLVEALACGTHVVTTRGTDIWREMEQAGSTITGLEPPSIARGILDSLAATDDLRQARGARGRQWVFDNLDDNVLASDYENMYSAILDERLIQKRVAPPEPVHPPVATHVPLHHTPAPPVSVIVLTKNEANNIGDCLASCAWCDDVHVLDSGSTDGTVEIARAAGATVHFHPFTSFGAQHNWIIDHIPTKHVWQFHIDADERFNSGLVAEMYRRVGPDGTALDAAGFLIPSQMIFQNRWIRHSSEYPTYQVRLIHVDRCRFIAVGHGQREQSTGSIRAFHNPYAHYSFSKGQAEWFRRHNRYSDREAAEALADIIQPIDPADVLGGNSVLRRRALKRMSYRLRGRGLWRFLYNYIFKKGWLDGSPGFNYAVSIGLYEYWTELKIIEGTLALRRQTSPLSRMFAGPSISQRVELEIQKAEVESRRRFDRRRRFRQSVRHQPVLGRLFQCRSCLRDEVAPAMPMRPLYRLLATFFSRSGYEHGMRGLHAALIQAGTEFMTGLLYTENFQRRRVLSRGSVKNPPQPARSSSVA